MSAEHERAVRLAWERYPEDPRFAGPWGQRGKRAAFTAGYLASKHLTKAEWSEKREQVARALDQNFNPDQAPILAAMFSDYADTAMTALGFTRTSEPGGDTC